MKFTLTLILFYLLSLPVYSQDKPKVLMLSDDAPPHMISHNQSGIDIDITREVLEQLGYEITIKFAPLKRSMQQVINKQADLFLPTFFQQDTDRLFLSDPIINYRPTVFTLAETHLKWQKLTDIKDLNVATFQGATGYFGDEFIKMSQQNIYRELHDMAILPELLLSKRADVVVLDYYIFHYFIQQSELFKQQNIQEHSLISEVKAHVGFNNKSLRDRFNVQLKNYLALKKDKSVINRYINQDSGKQ